MFEEAARSGYAFCLATGDKWSTGPLSLVYKDLTGGDFLPDPDRIEFRELDFDAY